LNQNHEKSTDAKDLTCVGGNTMSVPAPPNQTLPLVQRGVLTDYFIKTKNIPPEMSIEESLGAIPITLLFDSFCVYHLVSNC